MYTTYNILYTTSIIYHTSVLYYNLDALLYNYFLSKYILNGKDIFTIYISFIHCIYHIYIVVLFFNELYTVNIHYNTGFYIHYILQSLYVL